ncbi:MULTISPECIES: long-chain-fatty-acid--CoA ligase [unclassified Streptomyces]|uniref:long-chain-fatty-acid--CoA ligase n=1 Tax=unclassified Streptomyces TaxID=2593676 RepID=UPI000DB9D8CD|nr:MULTISPECIES: long-chain-fatty-acid--CoA ligase [unclassified Streptomyces]MYT75445.1 long-chain-fatty-acid--CoA ligase [Streptomyces sp. SID8367]RAJ86848.1 fatty-acyl-CoA synthase [Streptomyces sp. PsTaAH-137]
MPTDTAPAWSFRHHWMSQAATHAMMRPDKPALRFQGRTTTWAELSGRSLRLAAALADRGIAEGDRVVLLTLNHPWFVESVFAANSLGAMAVPLSFRLAPLELDGILADCTPAAVVVDARLLPLLDAAPNSASVGTVVVIGDLPDGAGARGLLAYEDFLAAHEPLELPDISEDATALIMYTSGTTGRPKGVLLSHRNMQVQALTCIRAMEIFDDSDIGFLTAPFFHIAGLGSMVANFVVGSTVVIHPLGAFDPQEVLDAYEREGATVVFNVPQQWDLLCAQPGIGKRDLKLRIISWGAAPASDATLRAMADKFPGALNVAVFGQTETSPITCVLRGEDSLRKLGSVGRPIPSIQYRVVDADMNDVPAGEIGEIVYRGPSVTRGYWNKPKETAEAFDGGWFHSGDLVTQDDEGFVWVVDRKKDMIISGGENIYCAELENAVAAHPAVLEVAVIGRPDERWGQVPVAYVTVAPGTELSLEDLTDFLDGRLASFKRPKDLVVLAELPRNAGGKVVKPLLRSRDAAR